MGCCGDQGEVEPTKNPLQRRKNVCCTDIPFLIVFILFWCGMVYIAVLSILEGNYQRLKMGYDSFGNTCGQDNCNILDSACIKNNNTVLDYIHRLPGYDTSSSNGKNWTDSNIKNLLGNDNTDLKHVFFFDVLDARDSMQMCVKMCPDKTLNTPAEVKAYAEQANGSRLCRYDIAIEDYADQLYHRKGPCPQLPVYKSISAMNRCIPDPSILVDKKAIYDHLKKLDSNGTGLINFMNFEVYANQIVDDLVTSYKEMLALMVIAVVISSLMVICIRYLASAIVWIIVALAAVGTLAGTATLWYEWWRIKSGLSSRNAHENLDVPVFSLDVSNMDAFLGFAICATIFTVIILIVLLVMRKRIALVVALFHEAGKCLSSTPLMLIQPVWTFLVMIAFFCLWLFVMGCVYSLGFPTLEDGTNKGVGFDRVRWEKNWWQEIAFWYHIVALIWTMEFFLACQQMVISGTVVVWYFTRDRKQLSCSVGKSTSRLILHHIGSVAFGSFIITLVKIPRYILMYIDRKMKESGKDNSCVSCMRKCCICCLWCLEKCLKFLNANAYTIIAITGKSFCSSAAEALSIIISNALRIAAINSVGSFVLFLGKVAVSAIVCIIAVFWFENRDPQLHMYALPVFLVTAFSFLIAHCFLTIYEMVVDTLLLCFCMDCKMNENKDPPEYYCSKGLMEYVSNASKALENGGELPETPRAEEAAMLQDMSNKT